MTTTPGGREGWKTDLREFFAYVTVCLRKGHDWRFGLNPFACAAGIEQCERCGVYWQLAHHEPRDEMRIP